MALRQIAISFEEISPEQVEALSDIKDNLGKRSKMGGAPIWIVPNTKAPLCPKCQEESTFVCQIDSIDYTGFVNPNKQYMFGDVGMIYVFFCFECLESHSVFQTNQQENQSLWTVSPQYGQRLKVAISVKTD